MISFRLTLLFLFTGYFLLFPKVDGQQIVERHPLFFGQFSQQLAIINPATMGQDDGKYELNIGTQWHERPWHNIHTEYAHFNTYLGDPERSHHSVGLTLIGDKEGTFLSRTYFYGQYAFHQQLSEETFLSVGGSIGFASFIIRSGDTFSGGTDNQLDASIGVSLHNKQWLVGFSINQLPESQLQPLEEISILKRSMNLMGSYQWQVGKEVALKPLLWLNFAPSGQQPFWQASLKAVLAERVGVETLYNPERGIVLSTGLHQLEFLMFGTTTGNLQVMFSREFLLGDRLSADLKRYELTLRFSMD